MQKAYQMNDIDYVDILIKLVFEIAFEKVEKFDIEKPIFQRGYCKGEDFQALPLCNDNSAMIEN